MTTKEIMDYLGVSTPTFWRYVKNGLIPYKINDSGRGHLREFFMCKEIEELKRTREVMKRIGKKESKDE